MMKWYKLVGFTVVVLAATILIRIPLPGGYFNFGDITVLFVALYAGSCMGAIAGGLGSALADLISGFLAFAPITLIAKGLEGLIAGLGKDKPLLLNYLMPILGSLVMVTVYFFGTWLMPAMGIGAAVAELPFNLLQALFANIGAHLLLIAAKRFGL